MKPPAITVGWSELVALPDWRIDHLRAKIDTGARSSSLHVEELHIDAQDWAHFTVPWGTKKKPRCRRVSASIIRRGRVRSSNGHYTNRLFVRTLLLLGGRQRTVELNLVDRGDMQFPMLIGRTALSGWYLVDPAHRRLASS